MCDPHHRPSPCSSDPLHMSMSYDMLTLHCLYFLEAVKTLWLLPVCAKAVSKFQLHILHFVLNTGFVFLGSMFHVHACSSVCRGCFHFVSTAGVLFGVAALMYAYEQPQQGTRNICDPTLT